MIAIFMSHLSSYHLYQHMRCGGPGVHVWGGTACTLATYGLCELMAFARKNVGPSRNGSWSTGLLSPPVAFLENQGCVERQGQAHPLLGDGVLDVKHCGRLPYSTTKQQSFSWE